MRQGRWVFDWGRAWSRARAWSSGRISLVLGVLISLFVLTGPVSAQGPQPAGQVKAVEGDVTAERLGARRSLRAGSEVYAGDRIRTGAASSVSIMLIDDSRMALGEKAGIEIKNFQFDSTRQEGSALIRAFRGVAAFVSGLLAKSGLDRMQVEVPTATIGVRGTEFLVEIQGGRDE